MASSRSPSSAVIPMGRPWAARRFARSWMLCVLRNRESTYDQHRLQGFFYRLLGILETGIQPTVSQQQLGRPEILLRIAEPYEGFSAHRRLRLWRFPPGKDRLGPETSAARYRARSAGL